MIPPRIVRPYLRSPYVPPGAAAPERTRPRASKATPRRAPDGDLPPFGLNKHPLDLDLARARRLPAAPLSIPSVAGQVDVTDHPVHGDAKAETATNDEEPLQSPNAAFNVEVQRQQARAADRVAKELNTLDPLRHHQIKRVRKEINLAGLGSDDEGDWCLVNVSTHCFSQNKNTSASLFTSGGNPARTANSPPSTISSLETSVLLTPASSQLIGNSGAVLDNGVSDGDEDDDGIIIMRKPRTRLRNDRAADVLGRSL